MYTYIYMYSLKKKRKRVHSVTHIYVYRTYKASRRNANVTTAPYNERRSTASRVPKWMTGNVWTPLAAAANTNERLLTHPPRQRTDTPIRGHKCTQRTECASLFFSSLSFFDSFLSSSSQGRRPTGAIRCFLISKKPIMANFIMIMKLQVFSSFKDTSISIEQFAFYVKTVHERSHPIRLLIGNFNSYLTY